LLAAGRLPRWRLTTRLSAVVISEASADPGNPASAGGIGLNNIGLLVRTTGRVGEKNPSAGWFMIDDGYGATVKVYGTVPSGATYVTVTGISSCEKIGGDTLRVVLATLIAVETASRDTGSQSQWIVDT